MLTNTKKKRILQSKNKYYSLFTTRAQLHARGEFSRGKIE